MLQQTINQLLEQLQHRVPANRDYRKSELDQGISDLPAPLSHFIARQIERRLSDHLEQLVSDPWLDASSPALTQQLDQLEQSLDRAARIPASEWPDSVAEAAREVVTYLVDPVSELADFVFREDASLPVARVQERMSFFAPYSYLHSVFNAYADRQSLQTINRDRFEQVLRRIDRQMVADYGLEKWVGLFEPLYEVLAAANEPGQPAAVPVELLQRLASNKDFDALAGALGQTAEAQLTSAQLRELISSALDAPTSAPRKPAPAEPAESTQEPESREPQPRWKQFQKGSDQRSSDSAPRRSTPQHQPDPTGPSPRKPKNQEPQKKGQPLWQRFQQSNASSGSRQSQSSSSSPSRSVERDQQSSPTNQRAQQPTGGGSNGPDTPARSSPQQSSTAPDTGQPTPGNLDAIEREVIGPIPNDQRERFVRRLFSGSQDAYQNILAELQSVDSWKDASSLIAERVFLPHQVNIYSEPAVTFTDLVEARFRESSSVQN